MRNSAREAALNIIFAQQFNTDVDTAFRKKVYKQFELSEEGMGFAADLVNTVFDHWQELIELCEESLDCVSVSIDLVACL